VKALKKTTENNRSLVSNLKISSLEGKLTNRGEEEEALKNKYLATL